jgi:ABC-type multidrug transport system ATPase subunit
LPTLISTKALGKRFDHGWLFRGVEIELGQGDSLVIRGRNGSGKSTLLRILAGLVNPSEGAVNRAASRPLGYFSLDGSLYPSLSIAEHFELAAKLRGIAARTDEWLERIELTAFKHSGCGILSTGMRSRVKLALAAQGDPDLLILDEPGAGLDESGRALVRSICDEQRTRGALILATNDSTEVGLAALEMGL